MSDYQNDLNGLKNTVDQLRGWDINDTAVQVEQLIKTAEELVKTAEQLIKTAAAISTSAVNNELGKLFNFSGCFTILFDCVQNKQLFTI